MDIDTNAPATVVDVASLDDVASNASSDTQIVIDINHPDVMTHFNTLVAMGMKPDEIPKGIKCASATCDQWTQIKPATGYKWWSLVRAKRIGVVYEHHSAVDELVRRHSNAKYKSFSEEQNARKHFEEHLAAAGVYDIVGRVKALANNGTPIYFTAGELLALEHSAAAVAHADGNFPLA